MSARRPSPTAEALERGLTGVVWVCAVAALLTPLIINTTGGDDGYMSPKWAWMASLAAIGLAALAGRALLGQPFRFPFDPILGAAAAFALIHAASIAWARSPSLAVERALNVAALTALLWLAMQVIRTRRAILNLGWLWVAVAAAIAVWTLQQDFVRAFMPSRVGLRPNLSDWRGYLAAGLGNTNHIGDLLALALLACLIFLGEARRRGALAFSLAFAVLLAAGLTVCWSVGSNLGLFAGGGVMLGLVTRRRGYRFFRRRRRWAALAGLWGGVLVFFLVPHPLNPHREGLWTEAFGSARWAEGGPTRLVIWSGGLELVKAHPWRGAGAGNFVYEYPEAWSPMMNARPELAGYRGQYTNAAHNILLQTWSELGALGLGALLAMLAAGFYSALAGIQSCPRGQFTLRVALAGMLAAWCAQGMMNFSLQQPAGAATLYILLAAITGERAARGTSGLPPLLWMTGPAALRVDWRTMTRPSGVGFALRLPDGVAGAGAMLVFGLGLAAAAVAYRPVAAQSAFGSARLYLNWRMELWRRVAARAGAVNPDGSPIRIPGRAELEALVGAMPAFVWSAIQAPMAEAVRERGDALFARLEGEERARMATAFAGAPPQELFARLAEGEEAHLREALGLNPRAEGMRSRYSELLVELDRPAEALEQLAIVRERLNSVELWEREARALAALGRDEEAGEAMRIYYARLGVTPR